MALMLFRITVPQEGPKVQVAVPGLGPPVRLMVAEPPVGRQQPPLRVSPCWVIVADAGPFFSWTVVVPSTEYELLPEKVTVSIPV